MSWNPPELSPEEELRLGEHIATVGRETFVAEFNKKLYRHESSSRTAESANTNPKSVFFAAVALVLILFLVIAYAPEALKAQIFSAGAVVTIVWFGSIAWASHKFDRWVNRLLAQYAEHRAKSRKREQVSAKELSTESSPAKATIAAAPSAASAFRGGRASSDLAKKWYLSAGRLKNLETGETFSVSVTPYHGPTEVSRDGTGYMFHISSKHLFANDWEISR
jgi:hypothetical protein